MRILLIEDDGHLCETLSFQLKREGFLVDVSQDGEEGLFLALQPMHDVILLDRMLPKCDGMEVLRTLRQKGVHTPVILLTALGQVGDRTHGLNSGADDYIVKPFDFEELLARIRCVLRRPAALQNVETLSYGDVCYENAAMTLRCGTESVSLWKLYLLRLVSMSGLLAYCSFCLS